MEMGLDYLKGITVMNEKKNPSYKQLFEILAEKFKEGSKGFLFQSILQEVIVYVEKYNNPPNWQDFQIGGEEAIQIYGLFMYILGNKAVEMESIEDDPVWEDANEILEAIRTTLEETHDDGDLELHKETLLPPYKQMEQAGLVEVVEGADGQKYVNPTQLCEEIADEVQTEINKAKQENNN